jgi:hypothetical protein
MVLVWWRWLSRGAVVLVVIGPIARYIDYRVDRGEHDETSYWATFLSLDHEANLPTFYAALLLLLLVAACAARAAIEPPSQRLAWSCIAVVGFLLALDEAASLHERFLDPVGRHLGGGSGLLTFAWVVPGTVLAVAGSLLLVRVSRPLPDTKRRRLGISLVVYLAGALGLELLSGPVHEHGGPDRFYLAITTVEEALEFAGVLLALRVTLEGLSIVRAPGTLTATVESRDHVPPRHPAPPNP